MPAKIKKRGENSYLLTVAAGYDGQGRQINRTKTVKANNLREAEKLYGLFLSEIQKGQIATGSGKMTLNDFFDYWLTNYAENQHAPKTIAYNKGYFKRISEALGHKQINKIEPKHLLMFYKNLQEPIKVVRNKDSAYLSKNTIRKYHILLHTLFEKALQWQFVAFNPVSKVEPPKIEHHQISIYDEETTGRFLLLLEKEPLRYRVMALLSLATGIRRGELFALQWRHIDFETGAIKIEQSAQYLKEKGIFLKSPKNESSKRIVTVPLSVLSILKKYKSEQLAKRLKLGNKWEGAAEPENDFAFTQWNGHIAHPDSLNTWLKKLILSNDLPHISPHGFRHMAATYLITSGTDLRTVAGKLGHKNSTTTQLVYSHLVKSSEQETADKLEVFMQQAKELATQKKQVK